MRQTDKSNAYCPFTTTKFGENRPLRSQRKVVWITTQKKNPAPRDSSQPLILPKILWKLLLHDLCSPRIGYWIWSGSAALCRTYSRKIDFSDSKSNRLSAHNEGTRKVEYAYHFWKCADVAYRKLSKSVHACRNYSLPKLACFFSHVVCLA